MKNNLLKSIVKKGMVLALLLSTLVTTNFSYTSQLNPLDDTDVYATSIENQDEYNINSRHNRPYNQ